MALTDKLTAIGNAIRQKTGTAELIPLSDMPNEIGAVYEAGYEKGKAEGGDPTAAYEKGVEDGKQAEYDAFWDSFQYKDGALRTSYEYGFYGWRGACFKPKHNLILSGQYNTYTFRHADLFDLTEMTNRLNDKTYNRDLQGNQCFSYWSPHTLYVGILNNATQFNSFFKR